MKNALTTPETRRMVLPWLTGDVERDALSLQRSFQMLHVSIGEWRQIVRETLNPVNLLDDLVAQPRTQFTADEVRNIVADEFLPDFIRALLLKFADSIETCETATQGS